MPIRFEIKPQIIEFLVEEIDLDDFGADDAQVLVEALMGLMLVHKCIVCPAPDAALVEALRSALDIVENEGWLTMGATTAYAQKVSETENKLRAALASVEQGGAK